VKSLLHWASTFLSRPSPEYNNLPPCPYALRALETGAAQVVEGIPDQPPSVLTSPLIIHLGQDETVEDMLEKCERFEISAERTGVWPIAFHPETHSELDRPMLFFQDIRELDDAAAHLWHKGYYRDQSPELIDELKHRRCARRRYDDGIRNEKS